MKASGLEEGKHDGCRIAITPVCTCESVQHGHEVHVEQHACGRPLTSGGQALRQGSWAMRAVG